VTTSAVVGIIIVLVLVGIGVGGWLLSHRHSGPKPSPTQSRQTRPPHRVAAIQLKPVSATSADDPQDASLAIDSSAGTFWHTSYYLDSPYFGNLKKGTGLVLDMGKPVKISQVRVKFGSTPGANVQIKVDNSALPPDPAAAGPLPTVAQANGVGGSHTFTMNKPVRGRYVVVWLAKLPPLTGTGNRYQANIYDVTIRGTG
jgi:hypothetical protein